MAIKVAAISDLHAGHRAGLTPPDWWQGKRDRYSALQRAAWEEYARIIKAVGRPDWLLVAGDCIDGRGERSGGTELITTDRLEQVEMAAEAISLWRARNVVMVRGTPYHTGEAEEYENVLADRVRAEIDDWLSIKIGGFVFDLKHEVSTSSVFHGQAGPLAREWLLRLLMAEREACPKADVIIRGHTHRYMYTGGTNWLAMSLPCLQVESKFGKRRKSPIVPDWGVVVFYVEPQRSPWGIRWEAWLAKKLVPFIGPRFLNNEGAGTKHREEPDEEGKGPARRA